HGDVSYRGGSGGVAGTASVVSYWTGVAVVGITAVPKLARFEKKIVPRVSVAKYRVPVTPPVTGSAVASYEEAGAAAEPLHVAPAVPMVAAPGSLNNATV